jgi:peptidoglycan/xylan/chitin deacetylase (PgdA/CDA1 family)
MSDGAELRHVAFHGVGTPGPEREPGEHDYWIGTDGFLRILDECAERTGVRISFDDGNASDVETALPALVERGLTAAFFPVADRVGTPGNVDRDGLRALVAAGMTVGTHGAGHRAWPTLAEADLAEELERARQVIGEEAGCVVDEAACPFGLYDRRVLGRLKALGYRHVYTSDRRPAREGQWLQARFSVRATDTVATLRDETFAARGLGKRARDTAVGTLKAWR